MTDREQPRVRLRKALDLVAEWTTITDEASFHRSLSSVRSVVPYDLCCVYLLSVNGNHETYLADGDRELQRCDGSSLDEAFRRQLLEACSREEPVLSRSAPWVLCSPLRSSGKVAGAFALSSNRRYVKIDVELVKLVARFIAGTLHRLIALRGERDEVQRQDAFLALLGHDLRSPLATISTALSALRLSDRSTSELDLIERQVGYMARLADDVLDVARIARGKIALDLAPAELSTSVDRGVERARPDLASRRQTVKCDVPTRGLVVLADLDRLSQVVTKVVCEASRNSRVGATIVLHAERREDRAVFRVRDSLVPPARPSVADGSGAFAKVAHESGNDGLDLELRLAREIVELHGGALIASSGPSREFIISLPRTSIRSDEHAVPSSDAIAQLVRKQVQPRRVLVVDDDRDLAMSVGQVLEQLGHVVEIAFDGATALASAEMFKPQVALLNIGLPDMDGYELARMMRSRSDPAVPMRLIALTGFGRDGDRSRARTAGFDAHLLKPVDLASMTRAIHEVTEPRWPRSAGS